ncbi:MULTISPECIES: hypothetical protein [Prosthecochloris]|uniref:Uncharacterized protein n=1 Tax=Prosthecochloris vibrioformis TaxID=1098 RepID=A0A5C4S3M7_PROVB|nr:MULTISPECIES: hypothetical protein [Prosthecochloris]ANT65871.1 hypothetical protein Ptc2401_02142 [Prosthecochloris sp. CIB 2401]TNJ37762.1 hypothetical protein FGF68_00870 [Prosthecochloris vibrioformis]
MPKANKERANKPAVKVRFLNVLLILLGADLVILFTPQIGILNSAFFIGPGLGWSACIAGLGLLVYGFRGLYRKT